MEASKLSNNLLPKQGKVFLINDFFTKKKSDQYFSKLTEQINWEQKEITIFGKKIMQPRLIAWCSNPGIDYTYSGLKMTSQGWPDPISAIKKQIEVFMNNSFNGVLLNLYRDQQDSMGWHRDNEPELGPSPTIASVSFGASRDFKLKHMQEKKLNLNLTLKSGSLLVMQGLTQKYWKHSLPKRTIQIGPRINLTFRRIIKS